MSQLREWLQDRLQRTYSEAPSKRHALINPRKAVLNSPFYRLPPELRRTILCLAFGGRILHLDLIPPDYDGRGRRMFDKYEPHQLRWWGCVCSRSDDCEADPSFDWCRLRWGLYPTGSRSRTEESYIGVMGWLLSSRMGYSEGVEVLYSTNTIHVDETQLIQNMDVVLPADHRALVGSLELSCEVGIFRGRPVSEADAAAEWAMFEKILSSVPEFFPGLRRLYLTLTDTDLFFSDETEDVIMDDLEKALRRVDSTIGAKARRVAIEVALPTSVYSVAEERAAINGSYTEAHPVRWLRRFRRDSPPFGAYWIRRGAACTLALFD